MSASAPPPAAPDHAPDSRARVWLAAGLIALAGLVAYAHSFHGPFILDDLPAIAENPTIRDLPAWRQVLSPPTNGETVTGRPLLNLSFALNVALGGHDVRGFHALNLALHLAAGLVLFGLVRRTLRRPLAPPALRAHALPLAAAVAVLWTVHPLATESVTYIAQRAESLVGLFYLLTLYGFIRSVDSPAAAAWRIASVAACLLGMATKEVMVTAPLLVLLYDRTFVAGSFATALRSRRGYYASLAATWVLLGWLALRTGTRGGTAGFGLGVTPWNYALTQCDAIVRYVVLAAWPHPLVIDYGLDVVKSSFAVWPQGLALLVALAATIVALRRWPAAGFLGAWFFALLAPSSSFIPVATQTMAEHRMYLPVAALVTGAVALGFLLFRRRLWWTAALCLLIGGTLTARRNLDYRSRLGIWSDTRAKRPLNPRAHQEYALALFHAGRVAESLPPFAEAIRLFPGYAAAHHNLASSLLALGRLDDAAQHYARAARLKPTLPEPHDMLGNIRAQQGRWPEAAGHYADALRLRPQLTEARIHLANALVFTDRPAEAAAHYALALREVPGTAELHNNHGVALLRSDRPAEAAQQFSAALRLDPQNRDAASNLALARSRLGAQPGR
ncbi:MAG: tetratricopeptide repeat protein [Verrucomicrobia bacterium]|nr:tetratricopeptide repeat protein [Verrucomicrobiota bacterium]